MELDDKRRKKIGSVLALSAMAPVTIIGTGVKTVSANDSVSEKAYNLLGIAFTKSYKFLSNYIPQVISYVLKKSGPIKDNAVNKLNIAARKSYNFLSNCTSSVISYVLKKYGYSKDAEKFFIRHLFNDVVIYITNNIIFSGYYHLPEEFNNEAGKFQLYVKKISETSKNFESLVCEQVNKSYESYEISWPTKFKNIFYSTCNTINSEYHLSPVLDHVKKLCCYVEAGDKLADEKIKSEKSNIEKEAIGFGWALTKAKLYFRIKSCINSIMEKLPNNFELISKLESSLPGKFNNEDIEEVYYGNTEHNLINHIFRIFEQYNVYKDNRLIDEETLKIINTVMSEDYDLPTMEEIELAEKQKNFPK